MCILTRFLASSVIIFANISFLWRFSHCGGVSLNLIYCSTFLRYSIWTRTSIINDYAVTSSTINLLHTQNANIEMVNHKNEEEEKEANNKFNRHESAFDCFALISLYNVTTIKCEETRESKKPLAFGIHIGICLTTILLGFRKKMWMTTIIRMNACSFCVCYMLWKIKFCHVQTTMSFSLLQTAIFFLSVNALYTLSFVW